MRTSIAESLDQMVAEVDLLVDRQAYENSLDSFAIFGVAIGAGYYQLFSGSDPDDYRVVVNTVDADTDETVDTFILPDDWE